MNVFKISTIFFILLCIGLSTPVFAQTSGGRKKEHRNQRSSGSKLFHRKKSGGHADAFAKGHKRGFLARIFKKKKDGGAWVYKRTNPGLKQNKEQAQLFTRNRTKNKRYRDNILAQQNRNRANARHKNSFSKRKR